MPNILGLDPGLTIGFALAKIEARKLVDLQVSEERTSIGKAFNTEPLKMILEGKVDVVVIEDFIGCGPRTKESAYTTKMIGAFELIAQVHNLKVIINPPRLRVKWIRTGIDLYLQQTGEHICHHGKDALAHVLRFCADNNLDPKEWLNK